MSASPVACTGGMVASLGYPNLRTSSIYRQEWQRRVHNNDLTSSWNDNCSLFSFTLTWIVHLCAILLAHEEYISATWRPQEASSQEIAWRRSLVPT